MKTLEKKIKAKVSHPVDYHFDDEQREAGDYINIDHSEYNRGNSRYGWYDPQED